jgi:hypothetical protein
MRAAGWRSSPIAAGQGGLAVTPQRLAISEALIAGPIAKALASDLFDT